MGEKMFVVVNVDDETRKLGYESGVGHVFLVPSGFQRDPLSWLCEESEAPTACGRTADGKRLVDKYLGDRMCGRCCRVVTEDMIADAVADRDTLPAPGESVADMLASDPQTVIITLDSVLAESDVEAVQADRIMDLPPGKERDRLVAAVWEESAKKTPKGAKNAGQKVARQSAWKSVKEVNGDAVRCLTNAPAVDLGNGQGECRSCGWKGSLKEVTTAEAVKAERVWCEGGKIGTDGCTKCGRDDLKINSKTGLYNKHKTPAVVRPAETDVVMVSHYRGGKAPVPTSMADDFSDRKLENSPATVDSGNKSADDAMSGAAAGMYRGRTSLTRGGDMTGAAPREREEGGKPVPTTNDSKLGRPRTDLSARTDRKIVETRTGSVKVVTDMVGGKHGFLSHAEYNSMRDKPGWSGFKKNYWRKVRRNRLADERNAARKAAAKGKGKK